MNKMMAKFVFKFIFGFLMLPAAIFGTFYYLNENGFFNIENIEIGIESSSHGQEQFLNPHVESLKEALAKYKGQSLWSLSINKISKELAQFDWIETTKINRSWPATLTLTISAYEVKLLFMSKNGKIIPIIKDGTFLVPVDQKQAPDVALLEGEAFLKKIELRKKAVSIIDQIPSVGSFSSKTISEIGFEEKEGFWMTMVKTGIRVKIGEDLIAIKASRISQVVDYLESHYFEARVIDANLSKKVLVRLRKDP